MRHVLIIVTGKMPSCKKMFAKSYSKTCYVLPRLFFTVTKLSAVQG